MKGGTAGGWLVTSVSVNSPFRIWRTENEETVSGIYVQSATSARICSFEGEHPQVSLPVRFGSRTSLSTWRIKLLWIIIIAQVSSGPVLGNTAWGCGGGRRSRFKQSSWRIFDYESALACHVLLGLSPSQGGLIVGGGALLEVFFTLMDRYTASTSLLNVDSSNMDRNIGDHLTSASWMLSACLPAPSHLLIKKHWVLPPKKKTLSFTVEKKAQLAIILVEAFLRIPSVFSERNEKLWSGVPPQLLSAPHLPWGGAMVSSCPPLHALSRRPRLRRGSRHPSRGAEDQSRGGQAIPQLSG